MRRRKKLLSERKRADWKFTIEFGVAIATVATLILMAINSYQTNSILKLSQQTYEQDYSESIGISGWVDLAEPQVQGWEGKHRITPPFEASTLKGITRFIIVNNSQIPVSISRISYSTGFAGTEFYEYGQKQIKWCADTQKLPYKLDSRETVETCDTVMFHVNGDLHYQDMERIKDIWQSRPIHQVLSSLSMSNQSIQLGDSSNYLSVIILTSKGNNFEFKYYFLL